MTPATQLLLGDRYRLTSRIAGGGMGEVWTAHDEVLGREVAVKVLRREYADDPTFLERFRAEARHTANLSHPNIAAVYDFGNGDGADDGGNAGEAGSPYLVMERVPGEPLSAAVARDGVLSPERTLAVVGQAALGLQAAHDAGVIHRDVKPGNILVTPDGQVRITDFGIARAADSVPLTQTGAIMGTAYYISPEQASGGSVTPASDIYSLGVVAYECLTGRRPFAGDTPVSVALAQVRDEPPALPEELPSSVRHLVMRMLAKDPADRPSSAGSLGREALALAPTVRGSAVPSTRVLPAADTRGEPREPRRTDTDPGFSLPPPSRRPRWVPYALALGLAAVLVLLVAQAFGGTDGAGAGGTGARASTGAGEAAVDVVAADLLGDPVRRARSALEAAGLRVEVARTPGGGPIGTVKAVSPTGSVRSGTLVTLSVVAVEPDPGMDPTKEKPGKGKGRDKGKGKNDERDD